MEILEIILYIIAYTVCVIALFLELVCYKKKIEYLETIFVTVAFLFFLITLSINLFFGINGAEGESYPNMILFSMILLGLTTPLNTFAERQVKVPQIILYMLYVSSIILTLLVCAKIFDFFDFYTKTIIHTFLGCSILSSMLLVRITKPEKRMLHREKSERIISLVFIILVPIAIFIEFIAPHISQLSFSDLNLSITLPLVIIGLGLSKVFDDLNRLSLFTSDNKVEAQNAKNYNLTPRETEIADLLIKGHSYVNICETLFIAMPTVKTHVSNIYKKVQVKNKIELLNALKS